jgi:hypothetical protein
LRGELEKRGGEGERAQSSQANQPFFIKTPPLWCINIIFFNGFHH